MIYVRRSEKLRLTCSQVDVASYDGTDVTPSSFISSSIVNVVNGSVTEIADIITSPGMAGRREENTQKARTNNFWQKLT